ncbi:HTH_Tnp_Tc3_2 domain-containing protein [Trichonephila clavipes]|uniref:HTH_Tnp_Tc3_2 domain-containing protein n=1 Tax=Trichonephila clavipes TaxID=2585209 RepID=A0A8X6V4F9_TRICX|nr:HTH_Tnp_Tc3_2 domain-containing protein [Trichonephila clavipes]
MVSYQDLSEFERGVLIGAREMEYSITEIAMKFRFSHTTISRVYREYQVYDIAGGRKKIIQKRDQLLTKIIKYDRRATFPQITTDFNAGTSRNVTVRTIERNIIDMGFRSQMPT